MNAAARLTPRRAQTLPPAPKAAPHPIPVAPDPTGDQATRNADRARHTRAMLLEQIPAKLRPAHL